MKTQIIQLSQDDDYISVGDKLTWSQAGRILLVWPAHGAALGGMLDLKLVLRQANRLGAQLALATKDEQAMAEARRLDVPVFGSIEEAQESSWQSHPRKKGKARQPTGLQKIYALRDQLHRRDRGKQMNPAATTACLLFSCLAILALGIVILPGAKIRLTPQAQDQSTLFEFATDPDANVIQNAHGSLPTRPREVIVEGSDTRPSTGSMPVPDKPAIGSLLFTNDSDETITIPAGTIVSTAGADPVRFITTAQAPVDLAPSESVSLPAQAMKPGSAGNLAAERLAHIEGTLGSIVTVSNPEAMRGGTDVTVPAPSEADRDNLHRQLVDKLMDQALAQLPQALSKDEVMIAPTLRLLGTLSESEFPLQGEPGNTLALSLKLKLQVQVVDYDALSSSITSIMDESVPAGYTAVPQTLEIAPAANPAAGQDSLAAWTVRASRTLWANISTRQGAELVRGTSVWSASERLPAAFPIRGASIEVSPRGWPWLPFMAMRIEWQIAEAP